MGSPCRAGPYVVVDLELTGLDREADRICEIGLVRLEHGEVVGEFEGLVRPEVEMSPGARQVHRIPEEALRSAPTFPEIVPALREWLDGAVLVGHHVDFDAFFLGRELEESGASLPDLPRLDTLEMARKLFAFRSHRLAAICQALDVEAPVSHRALPDAKATASCLVRMLELLDPDGDLSLAGLIERLSLLGPEGPVAREHLQTLQQCHQASRTVWVEYLSRSDDGYVHSLREFDVWRLVPPRVQGFCHLRQEERVFRLERMRRVWPGERGYGVPRFKHRI